MPQAIATYSLQQLWHCNSYCVLQYNLLWLTYWFSLSFSSQTTGNWVTVANLRQLDGGILDPDDRLCDVVDDRDQIIAVYTEHPAPQHSAPPLHSALHRPAPQYSGHQPQRPGGSSGSIATCTVQRSNNNNSDSISISNKIGGTASAAQSRSHTPDIFQVGWLWPYALITS